MNDINTIGTILFLVGIAIIILLFGYLVFTQFGLLGLAIYIAATCLFSGATFMIMD